MPNNNPVKSIGFVLKEARASKNISIEQASKDTKIHLKILKDLETDNFVSIGAIYAKSFIKIYGEYLGLNKDEMKRYFETAVPSVKQALKIPDAQRESRFNFSRMIKKVNFRFIWALVILFLFIYGGVKFIKYRKSLPSKIKKVEVKKQEVKKIKTDDSENPPVPKNAVVRKKTDSQARVKAASASSKESEKQVLTIKAKTKNWLQVKIDGKVIFQGVLAKGSAETWSAREKIELWLGDAGAVQLEFNGRLIDKIGRPGQTLKHAVLNKSGLTVQK